MLFYPNELSIIELGELFLSIILCFKWNSVTIENFVPLVGCEQV
jgi:hypothetical protein